MAKNIMKKPLAAAIGAAFVSTLAATPVTQASENPFAASSLSSGYMVADKGAEGKCGGKKKAEEEGKCAGKKKVEEGKCGTKTMGKGNEGKCGEGKCGGAKKKTEEGKCGGKK